MNHYWGNKQKDTDTPASPKTTIKVDGGKVAAKGNHIYFYKDIDQESVSELIQLLRDTEIEMAKALGPYGGVGGNPIHLHIHSYGGELLAGIAAADVIAQMNIHTHIEGGAASAATFLSLSGRHRTITPNSFVLIHQLSTFFWGKHAELEDHKESMDRFMEVITAFYEKRTTMPIKKLKEILKHDLWLKAEDTLKYGMVEEILGA